LIPDATATVIATGVGLRVVPDPDPRLAAGIVHRVRTTAVIETMTAGTAMMTVGTVTLTAATVTASVRGAPQMATVR
jgi:hypothetical protein